PWSGKHSPEREKGVYSMYFSHRQLEKLRRRAATPWRQFRVFLQCEQLEDRTVPSAPYPKFVLALPDGGTPATRGGATRTIRVVTYNMNADTNGVTTPRPGFYQVLEGIGEEVVQGNVQPLDILGLQETTSNSVTIAPIVTNLNNYYNGLAV